MRKIIFIALFLTVALSGLSFAEELRDRRSYRDEWCEKNQGQTDAVMTERMTCDCLTETHAVRVDFGREWTRALGFAMHYSMKTGKRGGVVLVLDKSRDYMQWIRLNTVIEHYKLPIDAWYIEVPEEKK